MTNIEIATLLAESLAASLPFNAVASDEYGKAWTILLGADRDKVVPDLKNPLAIILPDSTTCDVGESYQQHELTILLAVVDSRTVTESGVTKQAALGVLDMQAIPLVLHMLDSLPVNAFRSQHDTEINIDAFPLVVEKLHVTIKEPQYIGARRR